ncbi:MULTISPECIES: hypothetical protein [unclassified Delftia]|jgi:hypothetical protein|uniref:hypothetical protein n=1 Tax=unclassified Delftia TaxID=2613839 RepID=UPI0006462E90|nr:MULTISPECIES: hypothetical protein [unclassified Delftia]WON89001.1 hypothetical protein OK021_30500 [Delftia sp. UGAL515B_04]
MTIQKLKTLAREKELEVIEYPDGRVLLVGGLVNVNWWPTSRKQTAYVEGAPRGRHYATAKNVINLATKGEA